MGPQIPGGLSLSVSKKAPREGGGAHSAPALSGKASAQPPFARTLALRVIAVVRGGYARKPLNYIRILSNHEQKESPAGAGSRYARRMAPQTLIGLRTSGDRGHTILRLCRRVAS
jgi:hypothetical protein